MFLRKLLQSVDEEDIEEDTLQYARKGYGPPYSVDAKYRHQQVAHRYPRDCQDKSDGGRKLGLAETVECA